MLKVAKGRLLLGETLQLCLHQIVYAEASVWGILLRMEPSLALIRAPPLWGQLVICNLLYAI